MLYCPLERIKIDTTQQQHLKANLYKFLWENLGISYRMEQNNRPMFAVKGKKIFDANVKQGVNVPHVAQLQPELPNI